jgi:hypothetical protein
MDNQGFNGSEENVPTPQNDLQINEIERINIPGNPYSDVEK